VHVPSRDASVFPRGLEVSEVSLRSDEEETMGMIESDVYIFPQRLRKRKDGEVIGVFAVRDDAKIITATTGKTKEEALDGFKERVQLRCYELAQEQFEEGTRVVYNLHYTEEPHKIRAIQIVLKALQAGEWDRIRDGMLLAFDYTNLDPFFGTAAKLQDLRKVCPICGSKRFGKIKTDPIDGRRYWRGLWGCPDCNVTFEHEALTEYLLDVLAEEE
jgi:hypothetical protein